MSVQRPVRGCGTTDKPVGLVPTKLIAYYVNLLFFWFHWDFDIYIIYFSIIISYWFGFVLTKLQHCITNYFFKWFPRVQTISLTSLSLPPANKFWSGLLKDYYLPRASMYFNYLSQSLTENKSFKLEEWRKGWISYSNTWQSSSKKYPTEAIGDAYAISKSLFKKYLSWLDGKFPNLNPEFYYLRWRGML